MFAVSGWSVDSSALRTQTSEKPAAKPAATDVAETADSKPNKKRKRKSKGVDGKNLADLWETVIEGKTPAPKAEKAEKRQKIAEEGEEAEGEAKDIGAEDKPKHEKAKKNKTLKEKRKEKKAKLLAGEDDSNVVPAAATNAAPIPKPSPVTAPKKAEPKLTPLQASMRQKLISARFRHLNQELYTTPSTKSFDLFSTNPEMFQEYHEGFRRQVEVWPENPVDGYVAAVRLRGKIRGPQRGNPNKEDVVEKVKGIEHLPLPRTDGTCAIADLGCGDAGLTTQLEKDKKKLKVVVHSFDLQSPSPLVTKADIANLPLADGSVDVAVFCLALMGTNWIDFIEEAFRILRWKGELWVAEIKSRFGRVQNKAGKKVVEHSVGNRKKPDKKTLKRMEEEADDADLMVEVDGHESKQETDVSAFVEVLSKRGFVLQNERAVDLSNRMFVKMHFVKAATPIKGKCVPVPQGMEKMGLDTWKKKPKAKFIDEEDIPVSSEASVLKPCVYKLR